MAEMSSRAAIGALAVDAPGGVEHQEARGVDLGAALGHPALDGPLQAQRLPRRQLSPGGPVTHEVEGALADADPPHAVVDAARTQPGLGDGEAGSAIAQ